MILVAITCINALLTLLACGFLRSSEQRGAAELEELRQAVLQHSVDITSLAFKGDGRDHEYTKAISELRRRADRAEGHLSRAETKAAIAKEYASRAHASANDAVARVGALENATHKVQFVPVEDKIRKQSEDFLGKLTDPGNEGLADYMLPFAMTPDKDGSFV